MHWIQVRSKRLVAAYSILTTTVLRFFNVLYGKSIASCKRQILNNSLHLLITWRPRKFKPPQWDIDTPSSKIHSLPIKEGHATRKPERRTRIVQAGEERSRRGYVVMKKFSYENGQILDFSASYMQNHNTFAVDLLVSWLNWFFINFADVLFSAAVNVFFCHTERFH